MRGLKQLAVAGLLLAGLLSAQAQQRPWWAEPDLVVGRADADASGGWPVALLVIDGSRRTLTVRAPRNQLGSVPGKEWQAVDAEALLDLERFGAPRLLLQTELDPCEAEPRWGRAVEAPPNAHWTGEQAVLRHQACGAAECGAQAWRLEWEAVADEPLRLAQLLPALGRERPDWLVLHVAMQGVGVQVEGLPHLPVPPRQKLGSWEHAPDYRLPAAAAAQFPALHAALLEWAAQGQGLSQASTLMRMDAVSWIVPPGHIRQWRPEPSLRAALGLDAKSLRAHGLTRLLLRLHPADPVAELRLSSEPQKWPAVFANFKAIEAFEGSVEACEVKLAALQCVPSCQRQLDDIRARPRAFFPRAKPEQGSEAERLQACTVSCEQQKLEVRSAVRRYYRAEAQARQQAAWQTIEQLTGKSAADWRR